HCSNPERTPPGGTALAVVSRGCRTGSVPSSLGKGSPLSRFTLSAVPTALVLAVATLVASAAAGAAVPPGPASAPDKPQAVALRLPPPIVYADKRGPERSVTFSHDTHVAVANDRCVGCHPEPVR